MNFHAVRGVMLQRSGPNERENELWWQDLRLILWAN